MPDHGTVQTPTALELASAILQQLPRDISQADALRWVRQKERLGMGLRRLLMSSPELSAEPEPSETEFVFTVYYNGTIEGQFGRYRRDDKLTDTFFRRKNAGQYSERKAYLVPFGFWVPGKKVIKAIEALDLRPADMWEVLAFGNAHPRIPRKFRVIAPGAANYERSREPSFGCIVDDGKDPKASIWWEGRGTPENDRFLAVQKW